MVKKRKGAEVGSTLPRPLVPGEFRQNADGSQSTEYTIGVNDKRLNKGRPTVIPSIWMVNGKIVELDQASAREAAVKSGLTFPDFDTHEEGDAFAFERSKGGGIANGPLGFHSRNR